LDLLEILLNDLGMRFLRLDGSTPIAERQLLIDEFSAEGATIPVFLLSSEKTLRFSVQDTCNNIQYGN
jgi:SWI/SNF-related matrix-associated actin-dependent regulator 1 of chromatin subfamily A